MELSPASAWNYVCKAANLLCEEFEVGPGSLVDVRLPAHWQSICWVLAAWALGARVSQGGAGGDADAIVMTLAATGARDGGHGIVTSLDAWGGPCATALPAGFLDAGRELRMQPDAPMWVEHKLEFTGTAAMLASGPLTFAELGEAADARGGEKVAVVGMRTYFSGPTSVDTAADAPGDGIDDVRAGNSGIVTASALAAIVAVCDAGSIVVVEGDADFAAHIERTESVARWA